MIHPGSLSQFEPLPTGWAPPVVPDTGVVNDMLQPAVSPIGHTSSVEPSVTELPFPVAPVDLIRSTIISIWGPCSTGHFAGQCLLPWCWRTALFIVQLIVRQARHLSRAKALSWIGDSVWKGLLWRRTPTCALGATSAGVPTGASHTRTLPLLLDSLGYRFTTHDSWSGSELRNPLAY